MTWRALGSAVGLLGLLSGPARADGVFVWNKGADLYEPTQRALIYFDGEEERLILQARYEGPAQDFAWVVPVPAVPEVSAIEPGSDPFPELSRYTQLRLAFLGRGSEAPPESEVEVIARKLVGVYDVAVLAAARPESLSAWLQANGYAFPADKTHLLKHYTDKGWYYVAMRIEPGALASDAARQLSSGEIHPLRLRFRSPEPVYPFKITSANAGETELVLYLLATVPLVVAEDRYVPGLTVAQNLPPQSGRVPPDERFGTFMPVHKEDLPTTWKALGIPGDQVLHLMRYRASFRTSEIRDDLVFRPFDPPSYWKIHLPLAEGETIADVDRALFVGRKLRLGKEYLLMGEASLALHYLDEAVGADLQSYRGEWYDKRTPDKRTPWYVPWYVAHYDRGHAYSALGDCARAVAEWEQLRSRNARDCRVVNSMAWVLATCPDAGQRDGKRAVALAEHALAVCRATPDSECRDPEVNAEVVDTLAAAYAEDGQFDRALELMRGVMEKLGPEAPARFQQHLESYEQRRPWRDNVR